MVHLKENLHLRAFGQTPGDLDLDFEATSLPHLVTAVLHCCAVGPDGTRLPPASFWDLTVGERLAALLLIAEQSLGTDLMVLLQCPNPACGQQLEVPLSMAELAGLEGAVETSNLIPTRQGDENLWLRRPTGRDQLQWLAGSFKDERTARNAMIMTLASELPAAWADTQIPEEAALAISREIESHDPLVHFSLRVTCPSCQEIHSQVVDLQDLALNSLRQVQRRLLDDIHRLALNYHWSEAEIAALPPWRRAHYLARVEKDRNW
jgi:hypothetical protein